MADSFAKQGESEARTDRGPSRANNAGIAEEAAASTTDPTQSSRLRRLWEGWAFALRARCVSDGVKTGEASRFEN